jgi:hypothetical protein
LEFDDKYQFLLEFFPGHYIFSRYREIYRNIIKIINAQHFEEDVRIDRESLKMVVLDYFTDIVRLKQFQKIDLVNDQKKWAYMMYWFLRRHPVQILTEHHTIYDVNELVAIGLFFPRILRQVGINIKACQGDKVYIDFFNLLFYNLKYRTYTQSSLELMFDAFISGYKIAGSPPSAAPLSTTKM